MLILKRHSGESIILRNAETHETICRLLVCGWDRGKVKLGFQAPATLEILREEIMGDTPEVVEP